MHANDGRGANRDSASDRQKGSRLFKSIAAALAALFVFAAGVGVGDGRISFGLRPQSQQSSPRKLDYSTVDTVYDTLRANYDGKLEESKLLDGMKQGLAEAAGDPYTQYFTPAEAQKFEDQVNSEFSGIGAELGQDKDKNLVVISPISGTPAASAGLKPQDIIAEIDKQNTSGLSVDEAVSKIRGPKGTKVSLKLIRDHAKTIDVTITRDNIKVPTVETKTLDDNNGDNGKIGYLRINTFAPDTGQAATDEAKKLKDAGVKGIILDLRGNPGGRVDAAITVASLWLPPGKMVMQEKRGSIVEDTHTATGGDILNGLPTIVLLNEGSASASEIVASALRDNNAAQIYGTKSYGKGSVQKPVPLRDGSELKVTIARWYRPNGQNIDKKGIDPDKTVKISDEDTAAGRDPQLEAAQAALQQ